MLGSPCIKTYSQTQDSLASSSGESEIYGIVKEATMGIGVRSLMEDRQLRLELQVNTDASAARSMLSGRGAGRVRHVEVRGLWAQEKVRGGQLSIIKVMGEDNVAEGLATHVDLSKLKRRVSECGLTCCDGLYELRPRLGDV